MAKRVHLSDVREEDDQDLRALLERFIRRSEELEKRESYVLRQVERVQSAVASLQAWKQSEKPLTAATPATAAKPATPALPSTPSEPIHIDVKEIEKETQEIKKETERIQKEVTQKIEENKRLQEEIKRRHTLHNDMDAFMSDSVFQKMDKGGRLKPMRTEEIESRGKKVRTSPDVTHDPGVEYFNEKLRKLRELERRLKRELELESEEAKKKKKALTEKIDQLELGSQRRQVNNTKAKTPGQK